jgi:hypothetical protein
VVDGPELQQVVVDRVMPGCIRVAIDGFSCTAEAEVHCVPDPSLRALDAQTARTLDEIVVLRTVGRAGVAGLAIENACQHTRNMLSACSLVHNSATPLKERESVPELQVVRVDCLH